MSEPGSGIRWKKFARAIIPLPQRSILSLMIFLGIVIAFGMRVCLSITIVSVFEPKHESTKNISKECPFPSDYNSGLNDNDPIYNWGEKMIGNILSSFYIGYVITHIPGGILSDIWGGKHVFNGCILLTSLLTGITPISIIYGGPYLLIFIRFLMGLAQGVLFPSVNVLLATWIPQSERSFYGSIVFGGTQIGMVFSTTISEVILKKYHSWHSIYYVLAIIGIVWAILFSVMCSSEPQNHSYISDEEKEMLSKKIGLIHRATRIRDMPWPEMLINIPVLALVICECGHDFGFFVLVSYLPKYLSDVLHYDIEKHAFLSAMPFIIMFVISVLSGILADLIIEHKLLSLVNCRKIFTTTASFIPALGLLLVTYAGCDRKLVLIAFTVGLSGMGLFDSSLRVNGLDLSKNFAGIVMAYVNGVGAIAGIFVPIIIGMLITHSSVVEYRTAFWITYILLNMTCVVYIFFGSGDVQPFNDRGFQTESTL